MNIGINGIDDIQNPDHADQQDHPPGQQIDLAGALSKLSVRLLVRHPGRPGHTAAKRCQLLFKSLPVRVFFQNRPQLRITVRTGQFRIEPVTYDHLHAVDKTAAAHTEITVIPIHGQQDRQLLPCHHDGTSLLDAGRPDFLPCHFHLQGIAYNTPFSRL